MKTLQTFFAIACMAALLASCQKDISKQAGRPVVNSKVKTYTEDVTSTLAGHVVNTFNVLYDGSNRLTSLVSATNAGDKFIYNYVSANKYTFDIFSSSMVTLHEDFYINGSAFLDSTFQYNDTNDTTGEKYIYNGTNQVTTMKEYDYRNAASILTNTISYTYNTDGDLLTATGTDSNIDNYEYYTDSSYVTPLIIGPLNSNSTKKFHLIKKYTLISNNTVVGSAMYTYTFDASNRISTEKQSYNGERIVLKTYTYF
ncbi:MAG: hypothetical protein H7334_08990 [Ferruginibacter sp.]|nr:hypothetical protein [Ferruginibacter sp.]